MGGDPKSREKIYYRGQESDSERLKMLLALRWREGPQVKECRQKGKEMDSPPRASEGNAALTNAFILTQET